MIVGSHGVITRTRGGRVPTDEENKKATTFNSVRKDTAKESISSYETSNGLSSSQRIYYDEDGFMVQEGSYG